LGDAFSQQIPGENSLQLEGEQKTKVCSKCGIERERRRKGGDNKKWKKRIVRGNRRRRRKNSRVEEKKGN
jgi:hypothetical protein